MNIRLNPHSEELVKQQMALGEFRSPEEVIERASETLSERLHPSDAMSLAEFDAALDALAEGSERLPVLAPDATSRIGIYGDHN